MEYLPRDGETSDGEDFLCSSVVVIPKKPEEMVLVARAAARKEEGGRNLAARVYGEWISTKNGEGRGSRPQGGFKNPRPPCNFLGLAIMVLKL